MKLRSTLLFAAASLSAAALAPVAVTTTAFFAGTQSAEAASLSDAALSIDAFTSAALANLEADGWTFTNISSSDVSTGGVYTTSANQGAIGTGTSGASLTTNVPSGGDRYTWSAIFTVSKSAFEALTDGILVSGKDSSAANTGMVGAGLANGNITGAWQGASWNTLNISGATSYADANDMITIGFVFLGGSGSTLFVLNTDGTTVTSATAGGLKSTTELVTAVLSNKSGVSYSNLYWFNSKLEEPEMTAAMSTVGNGYVWAGTDSASTWNTETTNTNWIKDGENVAFTADSSAIFGNAAVSRTVAIDSAVAAGAITVLDDYTFTLGSGGSLTAASISISADKTATFDGEGAISGSLTKLGAGTVIFDSAGTDVTLALSAGTVVMNAGRATITGGQTLAGNLTINDGGTVVVGAVDSLKYSGVSNTITVNQGGLLDFGSNRWTISSGTSIIIDGGEIRGAGQGSNGALDFYENNCQVTAKENSESLISAAIRLRNSGQTQVFTTEANAVLTLSGVINGLGSLKKSGDGTLILSGNNSFSGSLLISGGLVELASANALGTSSVSVEIATGGTLDLKGKTLDGYYGNYVLSGGTLINTGAEIGPGKRQLAGGITLNADSTIGGTHNFGMISGNYAANTLTLNGHTLTKTGTNSFYLTHTTVTEGTVCIEEGKISVENNNDTNTDAAHFVIKNAGEFAMNGKTLGVASITTEGDGTISLGGGTLTLLGDSRIERITSAGTVVVSEGKTLTLKSGRFNTAAFTVNANAKVLLDNQYPNETLANVFSGAGSVEKTGAGTTTTLSGANTFTGGFTLTAGTVVAAHASALGNGNVSIADGATLKRGVTGALNVGGTFTTEGAAKLVLGELSTTTAAIVAGGDVTLSAGTIFELTSLTANGILVSTDNGSVTVDGGTFSAANFRLNGAELGSRTTIDVSNNGSNLTIASISQRVLNLTWTGGATDGGVNNVWKANAAGWTADGETDPEFQTGDNVTFGDANAGTVNVSGLVSVGTLAVNSSADYNFTGVAGTGAKISGTSALTKSGSGTATFTGIDFSDYSGAITINAGTLNFNLAEGASATLVGAITGAGTLEKSGAGTLVLNNSANSLAGILKISGGEVILASAFGGDGQVQLSGGGALSATGNYTLQKSLNIADGETGRINAVNGNFTLASGKQLSGTGTLTVNTASNYSFIVAGPGNGRDITQNIVVESGTIQFGTGAGESLTVKGSGTVTLNNSAKFYLNGGSGYHRVEKTLVLNDESTISWNDANNANADGFQNTFAGDVVVNGSTSVLGQWAKEIAITGNLSGAGTLTFHRYGETTNYNINSRLIIAGTDNSGFTGTIVLDGKATAKSQGLDLKGSLENGTVRLVTGTGANAEGAFIRVLQNATVKHIEGDVASRIGVGDAVQNGAVGDYALTVGEGVFAGTIEDNGYKLNYSAPSTKANVSGATLKLKKNTEGSLTLSGTNTFTGGLEIEAGTLVATQDAALGGAANAISVGEDGALELGFGGDFARELSGAGTLATTADTTWTANAAFSGSFNVKGGTLELTSERGRAFNKLSSGAGATFKANQDISFASVESFSGKLTGASASTRVSVSEGAFAGTLEHVSLVKTGATGTLDMSGASFATGGTLVVEGGTVSNLTLAGGGTLAFETTADASATMSNLTIYGGTTISIAEAFTGVAAASLTDTLTLTDISDTSKLTLEFRSIGFKEDYKVFTFTDAGKSAWETAFGTLDTTTGKFSSGNLTLAGIATDEAGKFSWQTNDDGTHTLLFQEDRDAETYYWRGNGDNPLWAFEDNWNPNAFASGNAAVFDKDSLVDGAAFVLVDSSVNANSVTIDLLTGAGEGATGEVTIQEWDGGSMLVREGITVRSGVLKFIFVNEDFYRNAFIVEGAGVLHVTQPMQDVTLAGDLSGTGVVRYADDTRTLTLSGDRSGFTGTLDVQAGTVVLAGNTSGEEVFGTVRIAEGAKVSATGSAGAVYTDPDGWGSYNVSKLSFTSVEGAGTLVVNSPVALGEKTFFSLDMTGSVFTGTVELNAIDLAVGTESHFAEVSASNLGAASVVRLTNGSSLNFFNEAATFAHGVEVAENGSVRVYGNNAGATISGDVYGAGTLTVKDGGKLILSGNVGTLGDDDTPAKTLGGLTLASGSLEITGAEMNVAGDVSLAGTAKIAAANGRIGGSVSMSGTGGLELGGTLEVGGSVSRAEARDEDGRTTTILAGAEVSVGGNMSFGNYENLVLEDGANLSVTGSLTNQWGFNATLGAGATLSAGTLASTTIWDEGRFLSFVGTGENVLVRADAISLNSGWGEGNQNARANFENLRLEIGAAGIDNAGFDTNWVRLKDVTLGVLGDADGWSTGAALKLNGGTTTFETAEGKTITLNGAVSEAADDTSSSLVKTGAGTLVLTQSNLNKGGTTVSEGTLEYSLAGGTYDQAQVSVTVGDVSFDRGAGLAVGADGTLKFSGASEVEIGSVAGTAVLNFEQGGVLKAASGTTIKIGQAGLLLGDVTFSSEGSGANRGKLSFADTTGATSVVRAGDSLTVSGGIVSIENGATLTVAGTLTLSGTSAQTWTTVGGDGTLKLDGTLATNTDAARLDVSSAIEFGADAVIDTAKGNLRLTGEIQESAGSTLTKRGGNELIFNSSIGAFSGALVVEAGKVTLEAGDVLQNASALTIRSGAEFSGTVTMAGAGKTFTLAGGTLTGNAVFTGTELKFGADGVEGAAPSSKIVGNLTISGTEITMNGDLISVTNFTWNDRNAITLSEAFSKSVVGSHTLIDFEASNLGTVDLATQADFDAGTEAYGRRTLALSYNAANTSLDVISTGTLIWNDGVNEWKVGVPETSEENLWTLEEAGSTDTKTAFRANDYVMFLESGEVAVADAEILTSGMVFNLEENEDGSAGSFVISSTAEFGAVLKDADAGANAGLSVISGNVQIAETVRNEMKAGVYIYGGSLTVANADSLGSTEADAKGVFLSGGALGFVKPSSAGEDEAAIAVGQKVTIGAADQAATVGIDVGAADLTVTIANALVKADADSTANLVKTGAGTLEITRDSAADALSVNEGTVRLTGDAALGVKNVVVAGTLTLNGDAADGADTAFESVILDGGKIAVNGGAYRAEAISGSGEIAGALAVGAVEVDGSGAVTKGTVVLTDDVLVLKGGISSYEQDGALVKSGAGTLALQGADENVGATIDAGIALDQGTLELTYGGTVSGLVETTGDAVKIRFGGTDATRIDAASAELAGGLILASGTNLTFSNTTTAGTLTVNGVALAEADAGNVRTTFDGGDYVIAGTAADFGKIDAADKMSVTALANGATVTVSAETFKAGALVLSDASTLTLGADNTSAEVGAIAVDRDETASIDLAGKTLTVTGAAGVSALQGSGTLTLVGEKDAAGELLGGLVVEGSGTYAGALYLELSDAKFTFGVGNDETAQAALNNVSTTEGRTGAVVKQGEGTLVVYGDRTGDLSFDGTIAVEGGVMELQTRASRAEIAIDAGSTLRFHGFAATRVNGDVNGTTYSAPLAENLTGAGTLEITGALLTNRDEAGASGLENFNGRLVATGGRDGGFILGGAALADWESNGATGAARDVVLRNGGTLVFGGSDETSANTLKHVSVDGAGTIIANARETVVDTFTKIDATAGSTLTLEGQGVANEIVFALDAAGDAAGTLRAANADWTLTGANSGLRQIEVSSARIVVADAGALSEGTAAVSVTNGSVGFSGAVGRETFTNAFTFGGNAEVRAAGGADVTLSGGFSAAMSASSVVFAATTTEEGVGSALSLSESALGLAAAGTTFSADAGSTVSVTVGADSSKALGNGRTLSGAGTFEKTGAGTLTIGSDAGAIGTLKASAGTLAIETGAALAAAEGGDAEIVSAAGAAVTIAQAVNLSAFTLTGEGDITIKSGTADSQATKVGGIADATAVKVSEGTLKVGGNVSGSAITFETGTALETTGGNVSVSGTTLAGTSLKLINSASDGVVTYGDDVTLDGATELTLHAAGGKIGGAFKAAYSGNLTKTGDGTWTVTNYTFGAAADQALSVNAGTLIWESAKFDGDDATLTVNENATLQVLSLAGTSNTLNGEIGGNGTLQIMDCGTESDALRMNATAAQDSAWMLRLSGTSYVVATEALPGSLIVEDSATGVLDFADDAEMGDGRRVYVEAGSTLIKRDAGTLTLGGGSVKHQIGGKLSVEGGRVEQSGAVTWIYGSVLNIEDGATFAVNLADFGGTPSMNVAKLTGTGTFAVESTANEKAYTLGGIVGRFEGNVNIFDGATLKLTRETFANAATEIEGTLRVAISSTSAEGRALTNLSGSGELVIEAPDDERILYAVHDYDTASNAGFTGKVQVKSGVLALDADEVAGMAATVEIGGSAAARYGENGEYSGILQGGFLQVRNDAGASAYDVSGVFGNSKYEFTAKGGAVFSGGEFKAEADFGAHDTNLFVTAGAGTKLTLLNGASVTGGMFVGHDTTLRLGEERASAAGTVTPPATTFASSALSSTTGGNSSVSGDFTLNGTLSIRVDSAALASGALLGVGGNVRVNEDRGDTARIILDLDESVSLDNGVVRVLGGNFVGDTNALNSLVEVEDSTGQTWLISRDPNGNLVLRNATTEYSDVPSGLSGLYAVVKDSALGEFIQSDLGRSTERLVALSPVSFGSLLEMQSGFASLENDLLRERLEQRRYERAVAGDGNTGFKPFVNVFGADREGDGDGTDAANYDVTHAGVLGGFDVAVSSNTIFGVSVGADWAKASLHDGAGKHEGDGSRLGIYGMSQFENAYFGYGLSAGGMSFDTKRNTGYNGETVRGQADGNDVNASFLLGAGWTLGGGLDFAPFVGLDVGYAHTKAFKETGGRETALSVESAERWSLRGKVGAALSWRASERLRLGVEASFAHDFLDTDADIDASFASGTLRGSKFTSTAYLMDENTIQVGPRVDFRIDETWSLSAAYTFETDLDETTTHSANVGLRARF